MVKNVANILYHISFFEHIEALGLRELQGMFHSIFLMNNQQFN